MEKFALSVLILWVVASPLCQAMKKYPVSFPDYSAEIEDTQYGDVVKEAFCRGIEQGVCQAFGLDGEKVRVTVRNFRVAEMRADEVLVILSGSAVFKNVSQIEKYVNDAVGDGKEVCRVEIEFG